MKAAVLTEEGVRVRDVPTPEPKPNEVLVKVRACGLNRADLLVASGHAHGRIGGAGTVIGLEWAGEVVACGAEATGVKVGDRVMCSGSGGWAEYAVTDYGRASPVPANNMSWEQAATLPVALQTMHDAIVTNGRMQKGDAVLIQGASSGVGLLGMKIARHMGARLVIGTSTNAERRARLSEFGADLALDSRDPGWVDAVLAATDGKGVELIVDQISGYVANQNMQAAAILGRIVNVGRLGGFKGEFDFDLHALRRIDYIGVTFRTRSAEEIREIVRRMRADLWDAVESGALALPIDRTFALDEAADALARMKANAHLGKIVLTV
ncbi:NADPH2:quinone reductase [Constrictibacter sp. MBR-5]|jgi:NADPH2:quinone reductase|uniref:zinc-binding dehydrogenase n=1 Tax=Constrictibacter sp. MBR-5 TaxID=3156467 RepID=UPI003394CBB2